MAQSAAVSLVSGAVRESALAFAGSLWRKGQVQCVVLFKDAALLDEVLVEVLGRLLVRLTLVRQHWAVTGVRSLRGAPKYGGTFAISGSRFGSGEAGEPERETSPYTVGSCGCEPGAVPGCSMAWVAGPKRGVSETVEDRFRVRGAGELLRLGECAFEQLDASLVVARGDFEFAVVVHCSHPRLRSRSRVLEAFLEELPATVEIPGAEVHLRGCPQRDPDPKAANRSQQRQRLVTELDRSIGLPVGSRVERGSRQDIRRTSASPSPARASSLQRSASKRFPRFSQRYAQR